MVPRADRGIGAVTEKLRILDRLDDTIILVMSDNPASLEGSESRGLKDSAAEIGAPGSFFAIEKKGAFVSNTAENSNCEWSKIQVA